MTRPLSPESKTIVRAFLAGAACGTVLGGFLVAAIVSGYGDLAGPRLSRLLNPAGTPKAASLPGGAVDDAGDGVIRTAESRPVKVPGRRTDGAVPVPSSATEAAHEPPSADDLEDRDLLIPVEGVEPKDLVPSFDEARGDRQHEALDILAPRGTPVRAVENGRIARLFVSKAGGITIYQFDPSATYSYYYAHLECYADGLAEGQAVRRGQVIGYVGTSGNAPEGTPHLHFAIFRLTEPDRWWEGTPIDPYEVLK